MMMHLSQLNRRTIGAQSKTSLGVRRSAAMKLQTKAALTRAWERCQFLPPLARSLAERAVN